MTTYRVYVQCKNGKVKKVLTTTSQAEALAKAEEMQKKQDVEDTWIDYE